MEITSLSQLDLNKTYTYSDYLNWKLKERVELIKGKIFKMSPAPSAEHQRIATKMTGLFWSHFEGSTYQVFAAPFDVRLDVPSKGKNFTVVQPDLTIVCDPEKIDTKGCKGSPDLVIEILSPGNTQKEMKDKFEVYEEAGIKEYWLVEPNDKAVFVFVLNDQGKYQGLRPKTVDETISSSIFPELTIDLKRVF